MSTWNADSLHRLAKALADSGEAETLEAAHEKFARYGVRVLVHDSVATDASLQIVALTVVNTAARSLMGNVSVIGRLDAQLSVHGFEATTLASFGRWLGLDVERLARAEWPVIFVGPAEATAPDGAIRPWARGWRFGLGVPEMLDATEPFAPACVAAGGLAVNEAFSVLRGDSAYAGRRAITLSLWNPADPSRAGPAGVSGIASSWLVGLGHLGQAYAWTLGFMRPPNETFYLQDFDTVTKSSLSTSMLCVPRDVTRPKIEVVDEWLTRRGYKTHHVRRLFDSQQRVGVGDPINALFGVDNVAARRVCEGAGFQFIVDAGLGSGYSDFRALRVRTFPGPSAAADLWANEADTQRTEKAPAYQRLVADGADPCGVTTLATRAVGAPFVGCVAAGYALAELARREIGAHLHAVVDTNIRDPGAIQAVRLIAQRATLACATA
jgi:hypothetical protein